MATPALRIDAPYARAVAWRRADPRVRRPVSKQQASDFARIAAIGATWGERLDELGATFRHVRWVAGCAGPGLLAERERRYRALVDLLKDGGTWKDFEALAERMPKVGRAATAAANRRALEAEALRRFRTRRVVSA